MVEEDTQPACPPCQRLYDYDVGHLPHFGGPPGLPAPAAVSVLAAGAADAPLEALGVRLQTRGGTRGHPPERLLGKWEERGGTMMTLSLPSSRACSNSYRFPGCFASNTRCCALWRFAIRRIRAARSSSHLSRSASNSFQSA